MARVPDERKMAGGTFYKDPQEGDTHKSIHQILNQDFVEGIVSYKIWDKELAALIFDVKWMTSQ